MKKSAIITLVLSASLLSACSNTSASSSKTKQVLNWFSAGEISTMDPALNNDGYAAGRHHGRPGRPGQQLQDPARHRQVLEGKQGRNDLDL